MGVIHFHGFRGRSVGIILLGLGMLLGGVLSPKALASSGSPTRRLTLLHINDLHSHFRPEKDALGLGGVARLKTQVDRLRQETPHTLFLDGGDWSEGQIYYNLSAGLDTIRMMEHLTIDAAVVGNHDWVNGPELLLDRIKEAGVTTRFLAANVSADDYPEAALFRKLVPPYVIREVGGIRVGIVGLVTYEWIYDKFFKPVKIYEPFNLTRRLARRLKDKDGVDLVVALSHNRIAVNRRILEAAPEVDLVVGAHDHQLLTRPVVVERKGASPGWVVEAGCWGSYLGRVDIEMDAKRRVRLADYRVYQIDDSIPEHPETAQRVEELEAKLESVYGPIFHDHVAHSHMELGRRGLESEMGNLVTDAYLQETQADLALDNSNFIYGELHEGQITTADVFNSNPAVWDPRHNRAWTLKLLDIPGRTLSWVFHLLFSNRKLAESGVLTASGLELVFSPASSPKGMQLPLGEEFSTASSIIRRVTVRGRPLELDRTYRLALSGGVWEVIDFLNGVIPGMVPTDSLVDTGQESWQVVKRYLARMKTVTSDKIVLGNRLRTEGPDLAVRVNDIRWNRATARLQVIVHNHGMMPTPGVGQELKVLGNRRGGDTIVEPEWVELGAPQRIPGLKPGESHTLEWTRVKVPGNRGVYPVTAVILGGDLESNQSNNSATRWFKRSF